MERILQTNTLNTSSSKNRTIKYIVIHYTAGTTSKSGTAKSTAKYFAKETTKASADFIVDDSFVVQYNPDIKNRYCWHCGGNKYKTKGGSLYKICTSANSIGIELCSTNKMKKITNPNDSNWYFTDEVVNNAIELVKELMKEYNVPVENVIRHYDVNGKPCPGIIGWNEDTNDVSNWLAFKDKLVEKIPVASGGDNFIIEKVIDDITHEPEILIKEKSVEQKVEPVKTELTVWESKSFMDKIIDFLFKLFK
jgi:N-acetylmuramoyl-L-alanine amidase